MNQSRLLFVLASLLAISSFSVGCGDDPPPAGGAGSTGVGGANTGTGGSTATGDLKMISDFETASATGAYDGHSEDAEAGWIVDWFTYTDTLDMKSVGATIVPAEGGPFAALDDATRGAGNSHVANIKGGGFMSWGAGMGLNFKGTGAATPPAAVDLSTYKGVSFWAKATTPPTYSLQVKVVDARNTPVARGGTCVPEMVEGVAKAGARCDDVPVATAMIDSTWKQYSFTWDKFKPGGWGMTGLTSAQTNAVISVQFQVGKDAAFDISVDNVALLK